MRAGESCDVPWDNRSAPTSRAGTTTRNSATSRGLRDEVDPALRRAADGREDADLAVELLGRVAVHVGRVAHLGGVPQAPGLVDALEPRHPGEELRDEHHDELRPALALGAEPALVVHARTAEQRALERPPVRDPLHVAVELAPVDAFGDRDHGAIVTHARTRGKAVFRTFTTEVSLRTRRPR